MSERDKAYYGRNKEQIKAKNREYYYRDPAKARAQRANYRAKHRQEANRRERDRYVRLRESAIKAYGGRCSCCGETEPLFLEIDHVNSDGANHRRKIGRTAKALVKWLADCGYPEGFQLLCSNCNQGKRRNKGICPHRSKKDLSSSLLK